MSTPTLTQTIVTNYAAAKEESYIGFTYSQLRTYSNESGDTDGFQLTGLASGHLYMNTGSFGAATSTYTRIDTLGTAQWLILGSGVYKDGVLQTAGDSRIFWVPDNNAFGSLNAFKLQAVDITAGVATPSGTDVTAVISVANVNDAPTGAVTITGAPTQGQVLTADTHTLADADGLGALHYQWKADGANIAHAADASTYRATINEVGKVITVAVSYTDGGNTLESVQSGPTTPVASIPNTDPTVTGPVALTTAAEDSTITLTNAQLIANASDVNQDVLTAANVTTDAGTLVNNNDGTWTLTPAANFNGTINLSYNVLDGQGGSVATTATQAVTAVNDAPVMTNPQPSTGTIQEDGVGNTSVAAYLAHANATDADGNNIGIAIVGATGVQGTTEYSLNGGTTWVPVTGGATSVTNALLLPHDALVRFTPNANENGTRTVTFHAWDETTGTAGGRADLTHTGAGTAFSDATDTRVLTVTPVNDAPTTVTDPIPVQHTTFDEDTVKTALVSDIVAEGSDANDVDAGHLPLGMALTSIDFAHAVWSFSMDSTNGIDGTWHDAPSAIPAGSALLLAPTAWVHIAPIHNYNGELPFSYRVWDQTSGQNGQLVDVTTNGGATAFSAADRLVTLNVTPVNDPAMLGSANDTLNETNAALSFGGTLSISDVDSPAEEVFVAQTNVPGEFGVFNIDIHGAWTYVANSAFNEINVGTTLTDTFTVRSADGTQTSVVVNIAGTDDAAVLSSATVPLDETNQAVSTGGTLTISDVDSPVGTLTFVAQSNVAGDNGHFSINEAGEWTYTANAAFDSLNVGESLTDTFTVQSADLTETFVTVTINGTNDLPVVSALVVSTPNEADASYDLNLLSGATDIDHLDTLHIGPVTYTVDGQATTHQGADLPVGVTLTGSTLTVDPLNAVFNTLKAGATTTIVASYNVIDANGDSVAQSQTITLTGTNDAPTVSDTAAVNQVATEDSAFSYQLDIQTAFADVDLGDSLTYTATVGNSGPLPSWLSFDPATLTFSGTPANADSLSNFVVYVVATDTANATATATFQIDVHPTYNDYTLLSPAHVATPLVNARAQISTVTIASTSGTIDLADTYTVTLNGELFTYEAAGGETVAQIAAALQTLINGGVAVDDGLVTSSLAGNVITITATTPGTGFEIAATGANATLGNDDSHVSDVVVTQANVVEVAPLQQVETVTFQGTVGDIADTYTVTVNGVTFTYQTDGTELSMDAVANYLANAINSNLDVAAAVTAQASGATITVTADGAGTPQAGTPFTFAATAANALVGADTNSSITAPIQPLRDNVVFVQAEQQVSTVSLNDANYDAGDVVVVTVAGTPFSYAVQYGDTANDIRGHLISLINAPGPLAVTASAAATNGQLLLTADVAGAPFAVLSHVNDVNYTTNPNPGWSETQTAADVVKQLVTVVLASSYDAGDTIGGDINGTPFHYTVTVADESNINAIKMFVSTAIAGTGQPVQTGLDGAGNLTIEANVGNVSFDYHITNTEAVYNTNALTIGHGHDNVVAARQVSTLTFSGTPDKGDVYNVGFGGQPYSVTAAANSTNSSLVDSLVTLITNDSMSPVTAANVAGVLTLTAKAPGVPFTPIPGVQNATPTTDADPTPALITAAVVGVDPVKQVSTVVFDPVVSVGEVFTVSINNVVHSVTATASSTMNSILSSLASKINTGTEAGNVDAVRVSSPNKLIVSADLAGHDFLISATNPGSPVPTVLTPTLNNPGVVALAQISDVDLHGASYDEGDVISVTIAGTVISYTVTGMEPNAAAVITAVANAVNANVPLPVSAAEHNGLLRLTADATGTPFTVSSAVVNAAFTTASIAQATPAANIPAAPQVETIDIGTTAYEVGDIIHGSIGGIGFIYTVSGMEGGNGGIANALASQINNTNVAVNPTVANNLITITADVPGTGFDFGTTSVTNKVSHTNSLTATTTHLAAAALPEISEVNLGATAYDVGDVIRVTVAGTDFNYTVTGTEVDNSAIVTAISALINADGLLAVTASPGAAGILVLTADAGNVPFSLTTQTFNAGIIEQVVIQNDTASTPEVLAVTQVDTVILPAAVFDIGDVYALTFQSNGGNATTISYTIDGSEGSGPAGLATVIDRLITSINADGIVSSYVTAVAGTNPGEIRINADQTGTPFSVTSLISNAEPGADDHNGMTQHNTTDNSAAIPQVSEVTLSALPDAGDEIVLHLNIPDFANDSNLSFDVSYIANAGQTLAQVLGGLADAVNQDTNNNGVIFASVNQADGKLVLTASDATLVTADYLTGGFGIDAPTTINQVVVDGTAGLGAADTILNAIATPQVSTVTINPAALNAGDVVNIAVNLDGIAGNEITIAYTVPVGATLASVQAALLPLINNNIGNSPGASGITASIVNNVLTLTENAASGAGFAVTSSVTDYLSDTSAAAVIAHPQVNAVAGVEVSTIDLNASGGTFDAGDMVNVTLNNHVAHYTVQFGDTLANVVTGVTTAVNAAINGQNNTAVTLINSAPGVITITENNSGTGGFSLVSGVTNVPTETQNSTTTHIATAAQAFSPIVKQVDTVNFVTGGGVVNAGDTYTVSINGHAHTYTATASSSMLSVLNGLKSLIVNSADGLDVDVVRSSTTQLTISAKTAGIPFTTTAANTDNTWQVQTPTPNSAGTLAQAEVTTIDFTTNGVSYDAGDLVRLTIAGNNFDYTVPAVTTAFALVDALVAAHHNAGFTLFNVGGGVLEITAATTNVQLHVLPTLTNVSLNANDAVATETNPNSVANVAQVDTVTLSGTYDPADEITVNISGTPYAYTTLVGDSSNSVVNGLMALINANLNAPAHATNVAGVLTLTAKVAGTGFTTSSAAITHDAVTAAGAVTNTVATANVALSVKQVTEVTLSGTFDPNDQVTVVIDGTEYSYAKHLADTTLSLVVDGLVALINADTALGVDASNVAGKLTLTAHTAGVAFSLDDAFVTQAQVTNQTASENTPTANVNTATAQVTDVTFVGANLIEQGDVYSLVIDRDGAGGADPVTISYTTDGTETLADVMSALQDGINNNVDLNTALSAVVVDTHQANSAQFKLTLSALNAGTEFTVNATGTNRAVGTANVQATIDPTVANTPATTPHAQVTTIDLTADKLDAGDHVLVTVNNHLYEYAVTGNELDNSAIVDALVTLIDGHEAPIVAVNNGGLLELTGNVQGASFPVTSEIVNIQLHANDAVNATPTPNVLEVPAVAQISTVTLVAGLIEAGDKYTVTIDPDGDVQTDNSVTFEVVTAGDENTVADIVSALKDKIDAEGLALTVDQVESDALNHPGVFDQLQITANVRGTPFSVVADVLNRDVGAHVDNHVVLATPQINVAHVTALHQDNALLFTQGTPEAGDTYSVTVDGDAAGNLFTPYTATYVSAQGETIGDILNALKDAIDNQNQGLTINVLESDHANHAGVFDLLQVVAVNAGTPFTLSAQPVVNRLAGTHDDNTGIALTPTTNVVFDAGSAQTTVLDFHGEKFASGETLFLTVAGTEYHHDVVGVETSAQIANAFNLLVNGTDEATLVDAAVSSGDILTLTGHVVGQPFNVLFDHHPTVVS